jgi:UDP-N-acetyl-D-galactosamine dehydrogenase
VDPYYLTYRAEKAGCHPEVILAGRRVNDGVGPRIARECIRLLLSSGRANPTVTVLGLTFKENVPDTRNSKVIDIITELKSFGLQVQIHDPMADTAEARHEYGVALEPFEALRPADAVVLAVSHEEYAKGGWGLVAGLLKGGQGVVMDVKGVLERTKTPVGVQLWRL